MALLFFTVIFGILELGTAFKDYLTTGDIARTASRNASTYGNDASTDYWLLQDVKGAADGILDGSLEYIVVYKAPDRHATVASVSASCAAGTPVAGTCNVYTKADLARAQSAFGCSAATSAPDRFWCPTTRKNASTPGTGGPPDFVGVYVKVTHHSITGFLGSNSFKEDVITRIEPAQL